MLSASGEEEWSIDSQGVRGDVTRRFAVWEETLVMSDAEGQLVGVEPSTGEQLWRLEEDDLPEGIEGSETAEPLDWSLIRNVSGLNSRNLIGPGAVQVGEDYVILDSETGEVERAQEYQGLSIGASQMLGNYDGNVVDVYAEGEFLGVAIFQYTSEWAQESRQQRSDARLDP